MINQTNPFTSKKALAVPGLTAALALVAFTAYPVLAGHHGGEQNAEAGTSAAGEKEHCSEYTQRGKKRFKHARNSERFMHKKLDLSDDQVRAMKEQREQAREQLKPIRDAMQANHKALHTVQMAAEYDSSAVEQLAQKRAELTRQMTIERSAHKYAMRSILTEAQREKMDKLRSSHKAKRSARKHRHMDDDALAEDL